MPRKRGSTSSRSVRSLERGLALLVAMNRRKLASVADLAQDVRLPRPTVYRLLDTLSHAGFVARDSATDRYRPTHGVRALSDGFVDDEWIGEISKEQPVVTYCVYGFHVGCQTAITLRKAGFDARYMAGGHYAWKAVGGKVRLLEE